MYLLIILRLLEFFDVNWLKFIYGKTNFIQVQGFLYLTNFENMLILELSQDIVSNDVYCCLKYIVVKYNYYKLFLEDYNHCIGFDVFYFSEIDLYNYIYILKE